MECFLQFIQDFMSSSTLSTCLFLFLGIALSFYFIWIPSSIPYFLRRPRLSCEDETENQITWSSSSPSQSQVPPQIKYDVFISFRGSDTRRGFLSHLLQQLSQKKIEAFVDYKIREGDELSAAFSRAIEKSHIALVIFSYDYASSKWCLDELVQINECRMKYGQIVVPIFYEVHPSDVRHQKGSYKDAFHKHKKFFKANSTKLAKWRYALQEVANLSGFHSSNFGTEAKLIEVVIQRVLTRLKHMYPVDLKGLVGIAEPIAHLQSLIFSNGTEDVRVIGIWGMGGIGKTTIAGVLFNTLCSEFEGCCFLANVRERSERYGIFQLKSELIGIILLEENNDPNLGISIGVPAHVLRRLRRMKTLIVLDDVSNPNQVRNLVGGHDWLGPSSRIIITTRDKHVINKEADEMYEVKALESHDAMKLLNLHAFNGKSPQMHWEELMMKVVEYAKGIPLAVEVLGSFLYGKSVEEWESQLNKLQKMPFKDIENIFRLSYEGLDREERSIFLYIACFLMMGYHEKIDDEKDLLDACGYSTAIALKTLQNRALITCPQEVICMHDLIREMGREIVREQNIKEPGKWSHLWDPDDIYSVLKNDKVTEQIECITMDMSRMRDVSIGPRAFARMVNLKFLRFRTSDRACKSRVHLPEGLEILSDNIRLFHWDGCPMKSFPVTFNPENLLELRMQGSHVQKLWDGVQNLVNLKYVDLRGSMQLIELPDFSKASRLRYIHLQQCTNLLFLHPSIFSLQNLEELRLSDCHRLEELPGIEELPQSKLEFLDLTACVSLQQLPDSIYKLTSLTRLYLFECKELNTSNLQIIFDGGLQSLKTLYFDGCCKLYELPENIANLSLLSTLSLSTTNLKSLPESIKHISQLQHLTLVECKMLQSVPEIPPSLYWLTALGCTSLESVFTPTTQLLEQHIMFAIQNDNFNDTVFSFTDCPNLDEDALNAVLAYHQNCNDRKQAMLSACNRV